MDEDKKVELNTSNVVTCTNDNIQCNLKSLFYENNNSHANAISLINSKLQLQNNDVNCNALKRNIEVYCTVRKPIKFSSFLTCKPNESTSNKSLMGNNQGQTVTSTDNEMESEFENSMDSINHSLLRDLSESDSCLDDIFLSKSDSILSIDKQTQNLLKFEDDFVQGENLEEQVPSMDYCTLRHKPKEVSPHNKVVVIYGTLKRKILNNKKLSDSEEALFKRISKVQSFSCDLEVQDYLKELDAYLDEIDISTESSSVTSSNDDIPESSPLKNKIENSNNNNNDCIIELIDSDFLETKKLESDIVSAESNVKENETITNSNYDNDNNNTKSNRTTTNNVQKQIESDLMVFFGTDKDLRPLNNKEQLKYANNSFCTLPKQRKKVNVCSESIRGKTHNNKTENVKPHSVLYNINKNNDFNENFKRGYSMRLPERPKLVYDKVNSITKKSGKFFSKKLLCQLI